MRPGKVPRHFPGQFEETDRDQAGRRNRRRSRKAEKTCPGRGPDGRAQTKPGGYGRKEEAGGAGARGSFREEIAGEGVGKQDPCRADTLVRRFCLGLYLFKTRSRPFNLNYADLPELSSEAVVAT